VRKEIADLNEKAGFTPQEATLFAKLQKKKERVSIAKSKVEGYKERVQEYIQELADLKAEVATRLESTSLQWFEITEGIAQDYIADNIRQD
ncbi:hypothetical protein, partial [Acinetobacter baumannii]|uniref:hypothetical protein n=1 Tax=Acinetobacter baumannii TaxID=470 RepID=UPI0037D65D2C